MASHHISGIFQKFVSEAGYVVTRDELHLRPFAMITIYNKEEQAKLFFECVLITEAVDQGEISMRKRKKLYTKSVALSKKRDMAASLCNDIWITGYIRSINQERDQTRHGSNWSGNPSVG